VTGGELAGLLALGAFHGLNPGMGWLFAVAIGLQERRRAVVLASVGPIAAGHLVSMAAVAVAVGIGLSATTSQVVSIAGGVLAVGMGMWLLLRRSHFRWVGMKLTAFQLATWSFLMASVHGAGLMLVPVLAPASSHETHHAMGASVGESLLAAGVHTASMLVVTTVVAFCVYEFLGLRILRTAWVNLDRVWAVALVGAGTATAVAAVV